jgi:multiple sugar transport system permease protein
MQLAEKQALHNNLEPQRRNGIALIGMGILLATVAVLMNRLLRAEAGSSALITSLSPLITIAGVILMGEGILVLRLKKGRRLTAWSLALPAVLLVLMIIIFPMLFAMSLSFLHWDLTIPTKTFIGFQNYITAFTSPRVWGALRNSVVIAAGAVALEFVLGVSLALLLADQFPGRALIVSIVIIPLMMAPIVVGETWRMLWDTRFGAVNHLLSLITGQTVQLSWLSVPRLAIPAIMVTDVWQWTPFVFLIALAGLLSVDIELYEAAAIDGASKWKMLWLITLPVIRPVLLVAFLFRLVDGLKLFDIVYALTYGGPGYSTETYPFFLFQQGFAFGRFGYTAAASYIFLFLVLFIVFQFVRRIGEV